MTPAEKLECWKDWPLKIAIAKAAREAALKMREGKPKSFRRGVGA